MVVVVVLAVVLVLALGIGVVAHALRGLRPAPAPDPLATGRGRWYATCHASRGLFSATRLGWFELADGIASFTPDLDTHPLWSVPVQQLTVTTAEWPHRGIYIGGLPEDLAIYEFRDDRFGGGGGSSHSNIAIARTSREVMDVLVHWGAHDGWPRPTTSSDAPTD